MSSIVIGTYRSYAFAMPCGACLVVQALEHLSRHNLFGVFYWLVVDWKGIGICFKLRHKPNRWNIHYHNRNARSEATSYVAIISFELWKTTNKPNKQKSAQSTFDTMAAQKCGRDDAHGAWMRLSRESLDNYSYPNTKCTE